MKTYPSISTDIVKNAIYAFDKLDGANIRAEWSRKKGFYKFGTRKRLLDPNEPVFGEAIPLIMDKYSDDLEKIFRKNKWDRVVSFFELHGPRSFAGSFHEEDQNTITLLDVSVHKKGILAPSDFLKIFKSIEHAEVLYHGKPNNPFADSVRDGSLEGMTFEGVVCKGNHITPGLPLMFKIKNREWIAKLKKSCGEDEEKFKALL